MIKIVFVCHGNICRSPMAEFVFKDLVKKTGLKSMIEVESRATSTEELGHRIYPPVLKLLEKLDVDCRKKRARVFQKSDYKKYDHIVVMDFNNLKNLEAIIGEDRDDKVRLLMDYCSKDASLEVADPWYTRDFDKTWQDVNQGCEALLKYLIEKYDLEV